MLWFFMVQQVVDTLDTLKRRDIFIKSPTYAAIRSALIPGWGQLYNGKGLKGVILGTLNFISVGYTLWRYVEMRNSPTNENVSNFLGALILNIAVWGYTIADAFVDAYLYGFKAERDTVLKDIGK